MAAGASRRMEGAVKQLLPYGDSHLLQRAVDTAVASKAGDVFVVLGAYSDEIIRHSHLENAEVLINSKWDKGLGAGISFAVKQVADRPDTLLSGVLIMLGDQPGVDTALIEELTDLSEGRPDVIVACNYGSKKGVPAYFGSDFFSRLQELTGDTGAGKLIAAWENQVKTIQAGSRLIDIDTEEDYRKYL